MGAGNPSGACPPYADGNTRRRRHNCHTVCHTGSGISLSDTAQNHQYAEKDLGLDVNEGYLVKETGPSAVLEREMKKIEALLEVHSCLEGNRQTVADDDTSDGSPLAIDPAAGGPAVHSLVLGYERLGAASSGRGRAIELAVGIAGPYSARRVADSEVVENLAQPRNSSGVNIVDHILLVHDPTAANTHLSLLQAPCRDFPSPRERFVRTHVADDHAEVLGSRGLGERRRISVAASIRQRRAITQRIRPHLPPRFRGFRNSVWCPALENSMAVCHRLRVVAGWATGMFGGM